MSPPKKKRQRKHRTPIAPPIHSAPGTPQASRPAPSPAGAPPSPGTPPPSDPVAPRRPKPKPGGRAAARRRRSRRRTWFIAGAVVVALVAAFVVPRVLSNRADAEFNALAEDAGCTGIEQTGDSGGNDHLEPGETTDYDTEPPTHGAHAPTTLPAGVYDEPLSEDPGENATIYRAVHSLEHGAIIVWHDGLEDDALEEIERSYRNEQKVLVAPYDDLGEGNTVALSAWGRQVRCEEGSTEVIDAFIDRFRGARTAPEPNNPI